MKLKASFAVVMTAVLIVLVASIAAQSQKKPSPTPALGQVTGNESAIGCPTASWSSTDLTLTLSTVGHPVFITFGGNMNMDTNAGISLRTAIDGNPAENLTARHFISAAEQPWVSYSRLYSVPTGTHTFTIQFLCQGGVSIGRRWMTIQESN